MVNVILLGIIVAVQFFVIMELVRINIIRIQSVLWKRIKVEFDDNNTFPLTRKMRLFGRSRLVAKLSILFFILGLIFIIYDELAGLGLFNLYIYASTYFTIFFVIILVLYIIIKIMFSLFRYLRPRKKDRVEYYSRRNSIWKLLKVGFIVFTFLPASVIRESYVSNDLKLMLFSDTGWQKYIRYLFPNDILSNLLDLGLPMYVQKVSFIVLMILTSTIIAWLIDGDRSQAFLLREFEFYDDVQVLQINSREKINVYGEWKQPQSSETISDGVLLLHGFGSHYTVWSEDDKELAKSENVISKLKDSGKRVFAIGFSDLLRDGLNTEFKLNKPRSELILPTEIHQLCMNNYSWELLLAMMYIKQVCKIQNVHLISHSTGGLVIRDLFRHMNEGVGKEVALRKGIYSQDPDSHVSFANKVSFLAVPHRGAKGTSNIFIYILKSFPLYVRIFLYLLFSPFKAIGWIINIFTKARPRFLLNALDALGTSLVAFISDGETPIDLNPKSVYLRDLNNYDPRSKKDVVTFYPFVEWQNASGKFDGIVGSGSVLLPRDLNNPGISVQNEMFAVDHAGQVFEDWLEKPRSYVAIQYSGEVWDWVS